MAKFVLTMLPEVHHLATVIPGRELCVKIDEVNFDAERANPESRTVHGAGFRVCAQEGASRNDDD
jgi:hypothetical protein